MQYTIEETLQDELDMSAAVLKPFQGLFAFTGISAVLFMGNCLQRTPTFFFWFV